MRRALRVTWYRYHSTFARQLSSYLSVVLLIGLLGGVAMASVASARRTQSSYPVYLASTNPSTLTMAVYANAANGGAGPSVAAAIRRLPDVRHVDTAEAPTLVPLAADGAPLLSTVGAIVITGSDDGMMGAQDRLALFQGHPWDTNRADEIVMTASAARQLGVHVGDVVPIGLYESSQQGLAGFGTPAVKPKLEFRARLVDIAALNTQLVQDDVDKTFGFIFVDHALIEKVARVAPGELTPVLYGIQLRHGDRDLATVERELIGLVPRGYVYEFHATSTVTRQVELAIKPESVALGAFGAIAALACLVLAAQALARSLARGDDDRRVMRALGAGPRVNALEGLLGVGVAIITGTFLAVVVAVALSPLSPLGPVRPVYPSRGVSIDSTVLGAGAGVLIAVLGAFCLARSARSNRRAAPRRPAPLSSTTAASLLPVAATVGVHFALDPGRGRTRVPVRSTLGATVLAVALVVATLTFSSGLATLVSRPPLYGWNWNYLLNPTNDIPPAALHALSSDARVAAWSGADYTDLEIDNQEVPVLLQNVGAKVAPPILAGHGVRNAHQIVLGAATLSALHKKIGDVVDVSLGLPANAPYYIAPTPLTIVGTATFPAVGYASFVAEHTSMGSGALLPLNFTHIPFTGTSPDKNLDGPELVFVRTRAGVSAAAGRADMRRVAAIANNVFNHDHRSQGNSVVALGVLRPVQIVNYRTIGSTPVVLAGGLALGAVLALGLTLASSVRRRRRDLAMLKTLGFTHRQLAAAIAWQASVTAVVGVVIGVPSGVAVGRELWILFARSINAVPDPTVPVPSVVLVAVGSLVFANLVAALPGRWAARTPAGLVLRAE